MTNPPRLTPEMLVPRLGDTLVQRGDIDAADLQKALAYQQERASEGRPCLLGQALVDLNLIEREVLDQAVTEQIIQLRSALQASKRDLERRVQERTAELNSALERLSELSHMKANFVANISHELRTPLTHIVGYLDLLATRSLGSLNSEQVHALEVSQRATVRLGNLIDDLIMFSLASRGEMSLKQEAVDLRNLVNLAVRASVQKAEERGVNLQAEIGSDLPLVQADPQKIGWVLSHLLDNAIKFTSQNGQAVITARREAANLVMISVADTGIGIPAGQLEEVFEPFHQLDGSSTRRRGGTGLGLSLVRQIVEAHGSLLDVQSVIGRGTTIKFPLLAVQERE